MADTATIAGARSPGVLTTYNPIAASAFPVGTAVSPLQTGGQVGPANTDSILRAAASGVAVTPGVPGLPVNVRYAGPVTLTTEEWDAITGNTGGLRAGLPYYVSDAVDGQITFVRPGTPGHFVTQIGLALSANDLLVQVGPTAQNT